MWKKKKSMLKIFTVKFFKENSCSYRNCCVQTFNVQATVYAPNEQDARELVYTLEEVGRYRYSTIQILSVEDSGIAEGIKKRGYIITSYSLVYQGSPKSSPLYTN